MKEKLVGLVLGALRSYHPEKEDNVKFSLYRNYNNFSDVGTDEKVTRLISAKKEVSYKISMGKHVAELSMSEFTDLYDQVGDIIRDNIKLDDEILTKKLEKRYYHYK